MGLSQLFLQRHSVIYNYWLNTFWEKIPDAKFRQRPHPHVNSIAWNIWHIARVEDAGLNRFVTDGTQVLDNGVWMEQMNLPWRHHGSGMEFADVDHLDRTIDLQALRAYSNAVRLRTQKIVNQVDSIDLDEPVQLSYVQKIVINEGLAFSNANELAKNYAGWSKGKCLMAFGLTHSFEHIGEMSVITSLIGIALD